MIYILAIFLILACNNTVISAGNANDNACSSSKVMKDSEYGYLDERTDKLVTYTVEGEDRLKQNMLALNF